MRSDPPISKLVDYLLLNAYSVNSTGLDNGRAGISLCLFEVAHFLQDEYIEEQAFELLQQSLLTKNKDIGFENGLSGIGYVLWYLIKYKFIDADFEELFGSHLKMIKENLQKTETSDKSKHIKQNLKNIFLFDLLLSSGHIDNDIKQLLSSFSETATHLLEEHLLAIEEKRDAYAPLELNTLLETYLKTGVVCNHFQPSLEVLRHYTDLYRQNKLACSFTIGYYLMDIATKNNIPQLKEVAETHSSLALRNIYPQTMTLAQRIDMLVLLRQNKDLYKKQINLLEKGFFDDIQEDVLEKNLVFSINSNSFVAGYQSGIARFLLYWVNRNINGCNHLMFL